MLFYLLSSDELREQFERLGYDWDDELISRNVAYYAQRTSHGSTLSGVVHSWALARVDRAASWKYFCRALGSDVDDAWGGTTVEGVHLGAMAGTLDLLQRCYAGLEVRGDELRFAPELPDELRELHLPHSLPRALGSRGHRRAGASADLGTAIAGAADHRHLPRRGRRHRPGRIARVRTRRDG